VELSVVVPVYNEAENIRPLIAEIRAALDGVLDYELIYVDDGSTDATVQRLRAVRESYPRLRILRHQQCCGQSMAVLCGVQNARAKWIATLDGDGQNDPADILKLLSLVNDPGRPENLHMVCGRRRKRQDSWLKKFSSRVANAVRSRLLKDNTPDTGCGLKLFSREAFLALPQFDHMHRFLPALIQRNGGQASYIEVNHRHRVLGTSKYGVSNRLWVGIVDMLGVMWLQRRTKHPTVTEE
jgi:dolichol-phosphate mannosyltransferase